MGDGGPKKGGHRKNYTIKGAEMEVQKGGHRKSGRGGVVLPEGKENQKEGGLVTTVLEKKGWGQKNKQPGNPFANGKNA